MHNVMFAMFSPQDLFLILIVAVFVFGPKRLPEIGEAFGKTIQSFKGAVNENKQVLADATKVEQREIPVHAEAKELPKA